MFNIFSYIHSIILSFATAFVGSLFTVLDQSTGGDFNQFTEFSIRLFSDAPIVVISAYDILLIVVLILLYLLIIRFILTIIKLPYKFLKGLGR